MRRTVLLIRHAKSSWDDPRMKDIDRPLNPRGREEARLMAEKLKEKGIVADRFICSPAVRTRETAEIFLQILELPPSALEIMDDLYEPGISDFEKAILSARSSDATIAIIAHNPGITYYAGMVANVKIDNMPTCSIFAFGGDASDWAEFLHIQKEFRFFESPKV